MSNIEPKPTNGFTSSEFPKNSEVKGIVKDILIGHLNKDNFLLGIIETVTISNRKGVGETLYLARKPYNYIKERIHIDYLSIIKEIDETEFRSPIHYHSWYERDEHYYVIHKNENCAELKYTTINNYVGIPNEEQSKKLEKNHILIKEDKIVTNDDLVNFYKTYTECFLAKEWFKEIPHYFILAKPISIQDKQNNSFIPLGNMYVVIGTKNEVQLSVYQEIVKALRRLWFQQYGDKILKEHLEKKGVICTDLREKKAQLLMKDLVES